MKHPASSTNSTWSRRGFLQTVGALSALAWTGCATTRRPQWRIDDSAFPSYVDDKTGAKVYNLTPDATNDLIVYQTHPMWTPRMEYLVFMSPGVVNALELATGKVQKILDASSNFSMQWDSANLFYMDGRDLCRLDVASAFLGTAKPEKLGTLPSEYLQTTCPLSVDATGDVVYTGVLLETDKRWGVAGFDRNGWRTLTSVDFQVGHVQANPFIPGEVMFCWETSGDAPQRTWVVDAKSGQARPAYKETYDEWVTHEAWWSRDRIIFTIWPYDDPHKKLPHGVACCDLPNGTLNVLSQYPAWHTHGSPDGRWALGDDFDRNIWLIDVASKQRRLLTQGHLGAGFKTHPHASFTPDSRAIVLNSSHSGSEDILLVPLPKWESLPLAE